MRRVAVLGVIVHNGQLLVVKHTPYRERVNQADFWCLPGGGVDDGEALLAALERELVEETGVKPHIGNLLYVQQFKDAKQEHLEFFFYVTNPQDYLAVDLSKSSHGQLEIAQIDFVDPKAVTLLPKFLADEPLDNLAGQPTKFFNYL